MNIDSIMLIDNIVKSASSDPRLHAEWDEIKQIMLDRVSKPNSASDWLSHPAIAKGYQETDEQFRERIKNMGQPYKPLTGQHRELLVSSMEHQPFFKTFLADTLGKEIYYGTQGGCETGYIFVGNLAWADGNMHQLYVKINP